MIKEREKERYREMSSDRSTSNSSLHTPQNEDQLKQKRKRTTYTIFGVIIALIASTLVESYFLQAEANTSIANNILILAVFNIIIILLFVLIVLIIRNLVKVYNCLLYTSPSPRDGLLSRMPSSA